MMKRVSISAWLFIPYLAVILCLSGCDTDSARQHRDAAPLQPWPPVASTATKQLDTRAQQLLIEGQKAFQMGQYEQAMAFLDSAATIEPQAPVIPFNRGRVYTALNQIENAQTAFKQALRTDPGYPEIRRRLGDISLQQGNLEEAIAYYREEEKIESGAELFVNMGESYYRLGQADSAQFYYERAIHFDSTNAYAHMMYGQLLEELGLLDQALVHSRKAMALDPSQTNYQFAVGAQLYQLNRLEESVPHLKGAADSKLLHYPAQYNLGQVFLRLGRDDEAQYYLARADSSRELMDQITNMQGIAAQHPNAIADWIALGELFRQAGERDRAIQAFNRASALDPNHLRLQKNIGEMMLAEGDVRGAIRSFQSILRADEKQPEIWKNLGLAFAVAGMCDDARLALKIALEQQPDDTAVSDLLAGICTTEAR